MHSITIKNNKSITELWGYLYLTIIYIFSFLLPKNNIVFIPLFICAIPFAKEPEKLLEICLIVSPIAYFFSGADEAVLSIYTIYALFCLTKFITTKKGYKCSSFILRISLIGIIFFSYTRSSYSTLTGTFGLIYVILISLIISTLRDFSCYPFSNLPQYAVLTLYVYLLILLFDPAKTNGRFSISDEVNVNTFGISVALLVSIIITDSIIKWKNEPHIFQLITAVIGLIMIILSGSRNSLMATIGAIVIFILIKGYREKRIGNTVIALSSIGLSLLLIVSLLLSSDIGIDVSRLSIASVISSGGSNRIHIWTEIIPYIIHNYFWVGLGPGKSGSHVILEKLVHRSYSHTHNTYIEAFTEIGFIGLIVTIVLIIDCLRNVAIKTKHNSNWYVIMSMFLCLLVGSIGESYFNDIILWLLIGILCTKQENKKKI